MTFDASASTNAHCSSNVDGTIGLLHSGSPGNF